MRESAGSIRWIATAVLCVAVILCGRVLHAEPRDHLKYLAVGLVDGLAEDPAPPAFSEVPAELLSGVRAVLQDMGAFRWSELHRGSAAPRLSGLGSRIFNTAAGFDRSLRGITEEEAELARRALDALFYQADMDRAISLLSEFAGASAREPDRMVGWLEEAIGEARRDLRTLYRSRRDQLYDSTNDAAGSRTILRWDQDQHRVTLRIEGGLSEADPDAWVEVTAPVRYDFFVNPVHLDSYVSPDTREVTFGTGGEDRPASTASDPPEDPVDPVIAALNDQIVFFENEATRAVCREVLWENTETGLLGCYPEGETPDGPFVSRGQTEGMNLLAATMIAAEMKKQAELLRRELARMAPQSVPEAQPVAELSCDERRSRVVPAADAGAADSGTYLAILCGPVQTLGNRFDIDIAIPADQFDVSDPNYAGSGTYHKLLLRRSARVVRGGGIRPGNFIRSFDLAEPATRVDLGVLRPGYYRLDLMAYRTVLAGAWLLVTVDERPGALKLAGNGDAPTESGVALALDAPPLTSRESKALPLPRYEIDVVQAAQGNEPTSRPVRMGTIENDVVPGQPVNIRPDILSPGPNLFHLVINDGYWRYRIDTLSLELGRSELARAYANFSLNGDPLDFEKDVLTVAGRANTVEVRAERIIDPFRGRAVFRVYRLPEDFRSRPLATPNGAPIGEIVEEHPERLLRRLTVFEIGADLAPGRYSAGVELKDTGQTWHLFFTVVPSQTQRGGSAPVLETIGGQTFGRGHEIEARYVPVPGGEEAAPRVFQLGEHVPGCAYRQDKFIDPNTIGFDWNRDASPQLRLSIRDPGAYLLRMVAPSRSGEPSLAEAGFEIVEDQGNDSWHASPSVSPEPVTARDREEAARNPWSGEAGVVSGDGCARPAVPEEKIDLHLVELRDGAFADVTGPARYGKPYYLEGRLEREARKPTYVASVALPDGSLQDVRLYKLEDQPDRVRSEIVYFVWDEEAGGDALP